MAAMAILKTQNEDAKKGKKVLTPEDDQYSSAVALSTASNEKVEIDAKTSMTKLARTINSLADESQSVRRKSLETIKTTLFEEFKLSTEDYGEVFSDICKSIFKRFADPVEKNRELAFRITMLFFEHASDFFS